MQAASDWELCKENIQPLKKGRVMAALQSALLPPGESSVRPKLLQKKREFEVLLRSYIGEDPLEPWQAYIDWTEQNFPKGGKEGSLSELLQQCILTFKDDTRYANDQRFVDICLNFADLAPDIMEVYQYMYDLNIGVQTAAFYRSWALQHENLGNIKKADELFMEGIKRGAEPKDELEMSHKQFTARIVNNMHEKAKPASPQHSPGEYRTTLGGLKGTGKKHRIGPTRTGAAKLDANRGVQVQASTASNAPARFAIFCDETVAQPSVISKLPRPVAPPTMVGAKKENERKPDKWSDVKVRQRVNATPVTNQRTFSVHVDENACAAQQTPSNKILPDSNVLSSRKAECPTPLEGIRRPAESNEGCRMVSMYCKEKLFCGVTEFQFEELRAIKWWKRHKKLEEEHKLKEREMQIKKREEDLEMLTARLRNILAKGGDGMLEEMATCMKLMDNLKLDAQSDSSVSSVSEQPDGPKKQEDASEHKMPQQPKDTDSNCSSAANSQTKTSCPASPASTGNTSHFVRAMFNGTIAERSEAEPSVAEKRIAPLSTSRKKCTFTVFGDEDTLHGVGVEAASRENPILSGQENRPLGNDENAAPAAPAHSSMLDPENEENLQNIPPSDYTTSNCSRKLSGILQPSTDIPPMPAEAEEEAFEVENDFVMEGVQPLASREITTSLPSNASFMNNLKISSTPFNSMPPRCTSENRWPWNPRNIPNQPAKLVGADNEQFFKTPGARHSVPTMDSQRLSLHVKGDLSTISEASNEYRSSSSSSSSSAATSHFKSQFLRCKTPGETSTHGDGIDKPKLFAQRDHPLSAESNPQDFSDPFKAEVTDAILDSLSLPLTARTGYCELTRPLPVLKENSHMQLVNDVYCIDKLCNTGGFAKIFSGSEMGFSFWQNKAKKLAFKVQRPACRWEFYIVSELISRLKQLENPVDVMPSIMNISKMYVYKSGSILVTEYHKHGTLVDVVNYFSSRSTTIPECLALYFTIEMLHIIVNLHACRIIHADIKPDNFLLMSLNTANMNVSETTFEKVFGRQTRCLKLIDFGRSIDMAALPPGTTFTKSVKTDMFECCEMKEGRPWTYQTDFYGLASCSHTLLFGNYMKTFKQGDSWKISAALKRYWHQEEWTEFFHGLLNVPSCNSQPDIAALCRLLEGCLLNKRLLSELCSTLKQLEDGLGRRSGPSFQ